MRIVLVLIGSAWVALVLLTTVETVQPIELAAMAARDSDGNPVEGRRVFLRNNCYVCHGGRAGGGMCPNLRDDPPDESDIRHVLEEGTESGMPAFPNLREQDMENLAAYFETLRTSREPVFTHWWEPVPTQ